jgi:type IV pilus assembly protein PilC
MPKFNYTATKEGKTISGTAEAISRQGLTDSLLKQGLHPLSVKQSNASAAGGLSEKIKKFGQKVKLKDLVIFSRQMSTMVSAGVPLTRSLATMETQTTNPYFKKVIAAITKDVEGGIALGDAFAKYPDVFSDIYVNMIKAGEAGGILDEILKRLAAQVEQESSMRKKIKGAMTYPTVILSITVIAFFGITMFVLPKMGKILTDLGGEDAKLPIYTVAMLNISKFMQKNGILVIILFAGVVFAVRWYIKTQRYRHQDCHRPLFTYLCLLDELRCYRTGCSRCHEPGRRQQSNRERAYRSRQAGQERQAAQRTVRPEQIFPCHRSPDACHW